MAQTVEKVYKLTVEGTDSINGLKTAIEQLTEKLKTLNETSQEYKKTLEELKELQGSLADAMRGISESTEKTNESLGGIKETVEGVSESISNLAETAGEGVMDAFVEGLAQGMAEAATAVTEVKANLDDLGQVSSVKDLKQLISDLRDRLVTLEKGTDEYKSTTQELIDAQVKLKEVMNAGKNESKAAEGSYNALSQRMSALKQVWKETTDEATRGEIGKQINEINTELKALDASIGNSQRNVGNYKSALDGLDASFVNWKQELKECKDAMQQLDPSTQAYADAMARAAELTHQMADQQELIKYSSTDVGDQLNNIRGIASNLAAGYSAVNAAMGLFGEENEEVQKAMLKVQQAMALVQGLQGIDGFIKRTKGLSQSMGLVTKATQANTVATKANAAASQQDAAAKGVEAAATAGAVPAQLSLNAAMEANPIGFIIGLIAALVTGIMLLKDKIMEMIGANEDMSAAFNKVKAVLSGVGNVIKKSVINPIKMAIIPIKTLAKVMIDLFKGDWSKIGDDIKDGFTEMKDTAIDTINVVGAFKEGYDKKTAEQEEAARKARAEARKKELDDVIKDNEAKYGSDWKYTEKGKKAYMEYFKSLTEMYDQDSEDYKQALRDKEVYLREFNEHQREDAEKTEAWELRVGKAYYGADYEFSKEWYNKKYQAWKKIEDQKWIYELANQMEAYQKHEVEWLEYLDRYNKHWESKGKERERTEEQLLQKFKSKFEKYLDFTDILKMQEIDAQEIWDNGVAYYKKSLIEVYKYSEDEADKIISMLEEKSINELWDGLSKGTREKLEKVLYEISHRTQQLITELDSALSLKRIKVGIDFPEGELDNIITRFNLLDASIEEELMEVNSSINVMINSYAKMYSVSVDEAKKALASISPEFQKLIDKQKELENEQVKSQAERFQKISDIYKQLLQEETNELQKAEDERIRIYENDRNEQIDNAEILSEKWGGVTDAFINNSYQQWTRGRQGIEDYYDNLATFYQRMADMYNDYAESEFLTAEEKEKAKQDAAKYTTLVLQAEADKQHEIAEHFKDSIKIWKDQIKSLTSTMGESFGYMSDYYTGLMDLEEMKLDQQIENNEISKQQAYEQYQLQQESFEKAKNFQAAQAMINGLSAAVGAYQSLASIPYVGPVLGAIAAAAALAAAIVNVQKIKATTMDNPYKESSSGGGSSTNFQLPSVMEMEPSYLQNQTGMSDTDDINNDGTGNGGGKGRGEPIECYVVESQITAKQELASKRNSEVTF